MAEQERKNIGVLGHIENYNVRVKCIQIELLLGWLLALEQRGTSVQRIDRYTIFVGRPNQLKTTKKNQQQQRIKSTTIPIRYYLQPFGVYLLRTVYIYW